MSFLHRILHYLYACDKPEGRSFHASLQTFENLATDCMVRLQRIRGGFSDWSGEPINLLNGEKLEGVVEVDEAYIGGQWRFMHRRKDLIAGKGAYRAD